MAEPIDAWMQQLRDALTSERRLRKTRIVDEASDHLHSSADQLERARDVSPRGRGESRRPTRRPSPLRPRVQPSGAAGLARRCDRLVVVEGRRDSARTRCPDGAGRDFGLVDRRRPRVRAVGHGLGDLPPLDGRRMRRRLESTRKPLLSSCSAPSASSPASSCSACTGCFGDATRTSSSCHACSTSARRLSLGTLGAVLLIGGATRSTLDAAGGGCRCGSPSGSPVSAPHSSCIDRTYADRSAPRASHRAAPRNRCG